MLLLLLAILIVHNVSSASNSLSNETLLEIQKLNELKYSHQSKGNVRETVFSFTISNTTYAMDELHITAYYFSITFIEKERHEDRTELVQLMINETKHDGQLKMTNLEKKGDYLVCVLFKNTSGHLISSSRFCHVVSPSGHCKLDKSDGIFSNGQIYVLLPFVGLILIVAVLFLCITNYVNRPRTTETILQTVPQHHRDNLENLAPVADSRRRRRTQAVLNTRLREDSVLSAEYDPNADHDYYNYHGIDNASLDTLPE